MDAGAEAEFRDFVRARWLPLVRTAILLTGDQGRAEDLAQQALVTVHRKWRQIDPGARPAYARAVLVNESASWFRRRRHVEVPLDAAGSGAWVSTPDATARVDTRDEIVRALRTLPPRMRAVIVLRYFTGLSEAETAADLGISVGSVKSQTSRGLDRLRAALTTAETTLGSHR